MDVFKKCYDYTRAEDAKKKGLYPYFTEIERVEGNYVWVNGKKTLMVGSNNYLGLFDDERLKEAASEAVKKYGSSTCGSRFLNGTYSLHVDIENLIDYMLDIFIAGNRDAPVTLSGSSANNFYAIRNRDLRLRQGWKFFAYDSEHSMLSANEDRTITVSAGSQISHFNPQWLHQKMMVNPDYRMKFADRAHRHMFNNGVMTTERATDLLLARAAEIDMAIIGESARWGDQRSDRTHNPYTKAHWWAEVNGFLVETFLAGRRNVVLNQLRNRQLYPNAEAPTFSRHGGHVADEYTLTMSAPAGTIYYTIDGTDPYQAASQPDTAIAYTSPVALYGSTHVKARVLLQDTWSALNEAVFAIGPVGENLRITEIMYHPADPNTEFIELQNVGSEAINLNMVKFVNGVDFAFPSLTLEPDDHVLVVENLSEFAGRYDLASLTIAGEYRGNLANGGEKVELVDALGETIMEFAY